MRKKDPKAVKDIEDRELEEFERKKEEIKNDTRETAKKLKHTQAGSK